MLALLNEEEGQLEQCIKDHIDRHPPLCRQRDLLTSIPGVGDRLSSYCLAWLPAERFADVRQAVAFVGLSPRHRQSGDSVRGKLVIGAVMRKLVHWMFGALKSGLPFDADRTIAKC